MIWSNMDRLPLPKWDLIWNMIIPWIFPWFVVAEHVPVGAGERCARCRQRAGGKHGRAIHCGGCTGHHRSGDQPSVSCGAMFCCFPVKVIYIQNHLLISYMENLNIFAL